MRVGWGGVVWMRWEPIRFSGWYVGPFPTFVLVSRMQLTQQYPGTLKPWIPGTDLGPGQIPQIYSNRLNFFTVPCPQSSCHAMCFSSLFEEFFNETKKSFWKNTLQGFSGVREMGDVREFLLPAPNYNRPVKVLVYKDLLTSPSP